MTTAAKQPGRLEVPMIRLFRIIALFPAVLFLGGGCGHSFGPQPAPLFGVPLSVNGQPVGPAIIDTGGGFEVMLREPFGLKVVDRAGVLAFAGQEVVDVVEGFDYQAGNFKATTEGAIVGLSVCQCNGLGFFFFRKTGAVLGIDFSTLNTAFLRTVPAGGVEIPFVPPPVNLPRFDSAFITVDVNSMGASRRLIALLDTGTNASVMRRGLVGTPSPLRPDLQHVTITHPLLGTVDAQVTLFDLDQLPDIIIGTDVMRVWADRWYFTFASRGGHVTLFPRNQSGPGSVASRRQ